MILVSGFNVYPNEIEDVVAFIQRLLSACIGVDDEKTGEAVKLFVVKNNPSLSADEVMNYCRDNFTGHKVPKHIEFIDELPSQVLENIDDHESNASTFLQCSSLIKVFLNESSSASLN